MPRILPLIAITGLGVGIVCLSLAWAIGGNDFRRDFAHRDFRHPFRERAAAAQARDTKPATGGLERRLSWNGDSSIDIAVPVAMHMVPGDSNEIVLRGDPDVVGCIQLNGSHLFTDCYRLDKTQAIDIEVPARALRTLRLSGLVNVTLDKLDQRELDLVASGSAHVQAQGTVERMSVTLSGAGDIRLGDVAMKRLTTKISGSGDLEAGPKDEADIHISGSGLVRLLARPANLHTKISGSGRIIQPPIESADKKL